MPYGVGPGFCSDCPTFHCSPFLGLKRNWWAFLSCIHRNKSLIAILLVRGGIPLKHYEQNKRVPMYNTDIPCVPSALFYGNYVVSMRPVKRKLVPLAVSITEKMDYAHGAPVQLGNPEEIGIFDIEHPDYGDPLDIAADEIPVFWACGVTAQAAAQQTRPEIMISHSPGYMLITDIRISDLSK